ncbi:hypothetical protein BwiPL1_54390 (plasmid) [Bacillus wiedmannii]|nr:hypothetical protein BwiPL1_54390 [Bacillus wiedmannii]
MCKFSEMMTKYIIILHVLYRAYNSNLILYKENRSLKLDVCFPKYNELLKLVMFT